MPDQRWHHLETLIVRDFTCGYCSRDVASDKGYRNLVEGGPAAYVCPRCARPTYFEGNHQFPGVSPATPVRHLPAPVEAAYEEARRCMSANAFTSAALLARKLLMNVAVHKGATGNQPFTVYVDYLLANCVGESCRAWVDSIRDLGNEATHELPAIDAKRAKNAILFAQMVLRVVYEYPAEAATM